MKRRFLVLGIVAVIVMLGTIPVFAQTFTPPTQSTSTNATDVVLWYGNSLTITELEEALVAASQVQADSQADSTAAYLMLLIVTAITALAFWRDNLFLYVLAVPVNMVYGFTLAAGKANGSPLWVGGIIIAIIGMYCLFKVAVMGLGEIKARRK